MAESAKIYTIIPRQEEPVNPPLSLSLPHLIPPIITIYHLLITTRVAVTRTDILKTGGVRMSLQSREAVIVALDSNRISGNIEAVEWALRHVVRPGDILLVLGIWHDDQFGHGKRNSCFPFKLLMGTGTSGFWERLEYSGCEGVDPIEFEEELERKRRQYQISLQSMQRLCKNNEVKLQLKLAAGFCPARLAIGEARKLNTRWIVLDRHFRKNKVFLQGHVSCSIALMRGKDRATVVSKATPPDIFPRIPEENYNSAPADQPEEVQINCAQFSQLRHSYPLPAHPPKPCSYPLSWRTGFPRVFSLNELEVITSGFEDDNILQYTEVNGIKVYQGILQGTTVLIKSFCEANNGFWIMLKILSRVCHRNIMNLVGYCCAGASAYLLLDYPCLGNVERNLQYDELARKLGWRTRLSIALEIGGSLRYLHEECADGPIVHKSVSSFSAALSHGYSAMLCNFKNAQWLACGSTSNEDTVAGCSNSKEDERLFVDVRDYGIFLLELITGKSAYCFQTQGNDQSMIDRALPLLENRMIRELMDCRVTENAGDSRMVHQMARAALKCLNVDSDHKFSINEALAIVRGDELAVHKN